MNDELNTMTRALLPTNAGLGYRIRPLEMVIRNADLHLQSATYALGMP